MLPAFLVEQTVVREEGTGPGFALGPSQGKPLLLTLGITRIIEQESLELSVWGSSDGTDGGNKPLASRPEKFYCGTYKLEIDLSAHPDVRFLRAHWKVNRWGRGAPAPLFEFYVFAQETTVQAETVQNT